MKKKLLILAHPHSSSSLLKSMMGKSKNAKEIINETQYIHNSEVEQGKIVVAKTPLFTPQLNLNRLQDHQLIFLIRNPCYSLESLRMRFKGFQEIPSDHRIFFTIEYYEWLLDEYINWEGPKLRYQDIFDKQKLSLLFEKIGLEFNENIYGEYERRISKIEIPTEKPDRRNHLEFRQWQINRPISYKDLNRQIPEGEIYQKVANLENFQKIFQKN